LTEPTWKRSSNSELKKVTKRLVDHGLKIELTAEAKEFLV